MITARSFSERDGRTTATARRILPTRAIRTAAGPVGSGGPQLTAPPGSALVAIGVVLVLAVGAVFVIRPDA